MKILYYFENIIFSSEDDISKILFQIPLNNSYEYQKSIRILVDQGFTDGAPEMVLQGSANLNPNN